MKITSSEKSLVYCYLPYEFSKICISSVLIPINWKKKVKAKEVKEKEKAKKMVMKNIIRKKVGYDII